MIDFFKQLPKQHKEENHDEKTKKRLNKAYLSISFVFLLLMIGLFYNSSLIEGINPRADILKQYAFEKLDRDTIIPGDFYDRNEKAISKTENGTEGIRVQYDNMAAYLQLIGYSRDTTLEYVKETKGGKYHLQISKDSYRLKKLLSVEDNVLYDTVNSEGDKGQDVYLTIDDQLQQMVFNTLSEQIDSENGRGSVVVLDAKTGEILSMVAFPTYDSPDELAAAAIADAKKNKEMGDDETSEIRYPLTYKSAIAPGSIFKLVTAVALIDHNQEDFKVVDNNYSIDGESIINVYGSLGDEITYREGIARSSNVFFSKAALKLGKVEFKETASKFMLNQRESLDAEDDTSINLDIGDMPYNFNVDLDVNQNLYAQTGFGQGQTLMTTLHAAMIGQAIANDGVMMKPYMISKIIDANGKKVRSGKKEVMSEVTSKETADKVTDAMLDAVQYYRDIGELDNDEDWRIFSDYQVAGKTGTAQVDKHGYKLHNAWFLSFAPASDPQYVIVANHTDTTEFGYSMIHTVAAIYRYLFEQQ